MAKIHEFEESAASAAHDKAADLVHPIHVRASEAGGQAQAQAHRTQEEASFFEQTGEQFANLAQGAIDGVKNTLGYGEKK
ncbi:hypothetical protein SASPL_116547 [Salvia splendens]|uniref:Uncharacterized protein n=1 Tax=Salvia splendens TaxID=180675 RepID=A0A8X8XY13_SALSN|nr:hypothetical protein SASPL_116547 [Salvia splendens]